MKDTLCLDHEIPKKNNLMSETPGRHKSKETLGIVKKSDKKIR